MNELSKEPQGNEANTLLSVVFRPKTLGELLDKLKQGIKCEVVASNEEITSICLDEWLKFAGKYKTYPSENVGRVIYEAL
jgi:hypothetical protein